MKKSTFPVGSYRFFCGVIALVLLLSALPVTAQDGEPNVIAITNGQLIDGNGGPPVADAVVIIEGERIAAVGTAADVSIPAIAQIIDAQGGTILPGIIDSHVHDLSLARLRRGVLLTGVTSICDLGVPMNHIPLFDIRRSPVGVVARGFRAGPIITVPGGLPPESYGQITYRVATPEEARAAVVDLHKRGVDMIKIYLAARYNSAAYPMLDQAQINAIVEEAHARGLIVRAHVSTPATLEMVLIGGVDVIEHVSFPDLLLEDLRMIAQSGNPSSVAAELIEPRLAIIDSLLEQIAQQQIYMVPTLARDGIWIETADEMSEFERQFILNMEIARVVHFREAGGMIAVGSDYGYGVGLEPGMPLADFDYLLQAGMTPLEIITASTRNAAIVCNQEDELGTLEPGKLADIIILSGDPSADIHALADVAWVIIGGEIAVQPD